MVYVPARGHRERARVRARSSFRFQILPRVQYHAYLLAHVRSYVAHYYAYARYVAARLGHWLWL